MENYFDNSVGNLVSFFVNESNMKDKDLDELMAFITNNKGK
jgi:BlaI family penicillinase repressor